MKLNENDRFDGYILDSKNIKRLEFALNKILKKKYDWINSIKLKVVLQDRGFLNDYYIYLGGMISVDENWAKQIWKMAHVTDFPGNEEHDYKNYEGLTVQDFLPRNIIESISNYITQIAKGVVLFEKDISYSRIDGMMMYFEDDGEEMSLKEHIRRVLKQETEFE
jgi:hypothetical protein